MFASVLRHNKTQINLIANELGVVKTETKVFATTKAVPQQWPTRPRGPIQASLGCVDLGSVSVETRHSRSPLLARAHAPGAMSTCGDNSSTREDQKSRSFMSETRLSRSSTDGRDERHHIIIVSKRKGGRPKSKPESRTIIQTCL